MPYNQCPYKKAPGYTSSRRRQGWPDEWIVLYKRGPGVFPELEVSIETTGLWLLMHHPSRNWCGFTKRRDAETHRNLVALGEDQCGILPVTGPPVEGMDVIPLPAPKKKLKKGAEPPPPPTEAPPSGGSDASSATRAREEAAAKPWLLGFREHLREELPPDKLAKMIADGALNACHSYQKKDGEVVIVPDYKTRLDYGKMASGYVAGIPDRVPQIQEVKKVTRTELESIIDRSPAARAALARRIAEAEAKAKA